MSLGLDANVRVFQMNRSLRREAGVFLSGYSSSSSFSARMRHLRGFAGHTDFLSQPESAETDGLPLLGATRSPVWNPLLAPGLCPLGLGASAIAPLTG